MVPVSYNYKCFTSSCFTELCFKKLFYSQIKLAISAALESGQNTSGASIAALSILNSSGASPGATEKVAALVARATCSGASHSSAHQLQYNYNQL